MAEVVQRLRPAVEISVSDPQDLDRAISRVRPQLVVCSDLSDSIRARLLAWVMLYPDGENDVRCCIAGEERRSAGIDLSELLSVVDDVTRRVQARSETAASSDSIERA